MSALHRGLLKHGQTEAAERLCQQVPALAGRLADEEDEEDESLADEEDPEVRDAARVRERRPQSADEVRATEIWDEFRSNRSPSVEQLNAFLEDCLSLPSEVMDWPAVLNVLGDRGHPDIMAVYRRLVAEVRGAGTSPAFVHMGATELAEKGNRPEWLEEIARNFARLDAGSYDPDALYYLLDRLMLHGQGRVALDLAEPFVPIGVWSARASTIRPGGYSRCEPVCDWFCSTGPLGTMARAMGRCPTPFAGGSRRMSARKRPAKSPGT